jgi:phosphoribosylformylglycinamidine cyclo-ligase
MRSKRSAGTPANPMTYDDAGVVVAGRDESGLGELGRWVAATFGLNPIRPQLPLGYYANVLPLSADLALAISTDGVGTKILVAEEMGRYDTIGIDCVAMNANDIICVGARPISMVDYIAVQHADREILGQIGKGLYEGARQAGISIPAGEIAQIREMISGVPGGFAFDLVGTCVGTVHPDRVLVGQDVRPGDLVVGLPSSGIHSNGLTLARRILHERAGLDYSRSVGELGRPLGEELLVPTHIYVQEVLAMLDAGVGVKALLHITGDGFLNLTRVRADVGYVIDSLLDPQPIFGLIQRHGEVPDAEMFRVFNMGTGFCVVVEPRDAERSVEIARRHGRSAKVIGYAVHDSERRVWIPERELVGRGDLFEPAAGASVPPCPV